MVEHSYHVCMCDYGQCGLEAVVDPEITRRGVISRIASGEYRNVAFVHFIDGLSVEDVTEEVMTAAQALALQAAE